MFLLLKAQNYKNTFEKRYENLVEMVSKIGIDTSRHEKTHQKQVFLGGLRHLETDSLFLSSKNLQKFENNEKKIIFALLFKAH
jgi:ChAPs (Chs5p-Arf1p-binding proteins)